MVVFDTDSDADTGPDTLAVACFLRLPAAFRD